MNNHILRFYSPSCTSWSEYRLIKRDTIFNMNKGGFTIVELIIVVTVIGILASISVIAFNGTQERAKANLIAEDLKNIEDAFSLYATKSNIADWPYENSFGQGTNPNMNNIIANTSLGNYLSPLKPIKGYSSSTYIYDNDPSDPDETFKSCGQNLNGVNIRISGVDQKMAQALDSAIDDDNLNCGRVRWLSSDSMIKYILSESRVMH